jgi:hypothetical protein
LSATVAPTPSSAALILSASSSVMPSLTIAFDEVFGFLEAKRGDVPNHLDDLDLLIADSEENDRELTARFGGCVGEADRPNRSETDATGANWPLAFRERAAASVGTDDPARGLLLKQRLKRNRQRSEGYRSRGDPKTHPQWVDRRKLFLGHKPGKSRPAWSSSTGGRPRDDRMSCALQFKTGRWLAKTGNRTDEGRRNDAGWMAVNELSAWPERQSDGTTEAARHD